MILKRSLLRNIYKFSVDWTKSTEAVIDSISRESKNYLKENGPSAISYMHDLLEDNKWKSLNKFLYHVDYKSINKWALWENLAHQIHSKIKCTEFSGLKIETISDMMEVLWKINYEPNQKKDEKLLNFIKHYFKSCNLEDGP